MFRENINVAHAGLNCAHAEKRKIKSLVFVFFGMIFIQVGLLNAQNQEPKIEISSFSKVLLEHFKLIDDLATLTYKFDYEGDTIVTLASISQKTKLKTLTTEQLRIKLIDKKNRVFEIHKYFIEMQLWVNGVKTDIP